MQGQRRKAVVRTGKETVVLTTEQMRTRPEYQAYMAVFRILSALKPHERSNVMDWISECYCPGCGFPAPPGGEKCDNC
jgi:hypothetical protein